jgi:hypothetical protein
VAGSARTAHREESLLDLLPTQVSIDGFDGGAAAKRSEPPRRLPLRPPRMALLFSLEDPATI